MAVAGFHFQSPTGVWRHHIQQNSGLKLAMTLLPIGILTALCFIIPVIDKLEQKPPAAEKKTQERGKEVSSGRKSLLKGNIQGVSAKQMIIYFSIIVLVADAVAMCILVVP